MWWLNKKKRSTVTKIFLLQNQWQRINQHQFLLFFPFLSNFFFVLFFFYIRYFFTFFFLARRDAAATRFWLLENQTSPTLHWRSPWQPNCKTTCCCVCALVAVLRVVAQIVVVIVVLITYISFLSSRTLATICPWLTENCIKQTYIYTYNMTINQLMMDIIFYL